MSDIYGGRDSLDCFNLLLEKGKVDYIEELIQLYEISYRELLIQGNSRFLDLIYNKVLESGAKEVKLKNICIYEKTFTTLASVSRAAVNYIKGKRSLNFYDAFSFICGFYFYLDDSNEKFKDYWLERAPKLFHEIKYPCNRETKEYIKAFLNSLDNSIYDIRKNLFMKRTNDDADILKTATDCRKMRESASRYRDETINNTNREAQSLKKKAEEQAYEQAEIILEKARRKVADEEENTRITIIQNAHDEASRIKQSGEAQANKFFSEAQAKQIRIIENAKKEAEKIIGKAKKRAIEIQHRVDRTCSKNKSTYCDTSFKDIRGRLLALNDSLSIVNGKMKKMEDVVNQQHTQVIYDQLTELYDLIDDVKTSTYKYAQEENSLYLKNAALNMGDFQEMITGYLEAYGISTIYSVPGDPFDGKIHAVKTKDFDPQNSIVTKSLKVGFMWGDQVMQKEIVEIKNKEL